MAGPLDALIAQGPGRVDFSALGDLPKSYWEGLDQNFKQKQQDLFKDGVPTDDKGNIDFSAVGKAVLKNAGAGGIGPAVEVGKLQQQKDLIAGLQNLGTGVFGNNQPAANAQPIVSPSTSRTVPIPQGQTTPGDFGNAPTIMGLTLARTGGDEAKARALADAISKASGIAPDDPLIGPKRDAAVKAAQLVMSGGQQPQTPLGGVPLPQPRPMDAPGMPGAPPPAAPQVPQQPIPQQQAPVEQPHPIAPGAGMTTDPTLGGLVPQGRTAEQQLGLLRQAASMAAATGVRNAEKPYLDAIDAIQKALQPTNENKNFQTGRLPNEAMPQYEARVARMKASATEVGKAVGGQQADYIDQGRSAYKRVQQLDVMRDALERGKGDITTGPFADVVLKSKQALGSLFGIDLNGLSEAEVVQKMGFGFATQAVKEISARPSQQEFLKGMENNPGLLLSPKGSLLMMDVLRQAARQDSEVAKLATKWKDDPDRFEAAKDAYYERNPLVSPFDKSRKLGLKDFEILQNQPQTPTQTSQPIKFGSPADVNAAVKAGKLKKGDTFLDSNGVKRVVP